MIQKIDNLQLSHIIDNKLITEFSSAQNIKMIRMFTKLTFDRTKRSLAGSRGASTLYFIA